MTNEVKNDGINIEATALSIEDAEAEAMLAEAEAEAESEGSKKPELNMEESGEEPNEAPKDEESEETPKGDNDDDMSIDYIEERIDELMDKGRANWSPEERREYRRLDQALEAYENGESVEDVAKADGRASKLMGEDAITEANIKKFDSMLAKLDLDYGEENYFAKSLIRTSNTEVRIQYGEGEETIYTVIDGDGYEGVRSGAYSFSWDETNPTLSIDYQRRRLVDQLLGLDAIRAKVSEGLNIKKGSIDFVAHYDEETDETKIGNPTYSAKVGKGKGGVLGAKSSNGFPKGRIILSEDYIHEGPFGTVTVKGGEWSSIASMFDTKYKPDEGFTEENLHRNGGDWGPLAKAYSSDAKTYTFHRNGYKNPPGATTGIRVIEGLLEAMPREQGKELAQLLKVKNGELSFAEVSPKFRKFCGYDDDDNANNGDKVIDNDVEGNT